MLHSIYSHFRKTRHVPAVKPVGCKIHRENPAFGAVLGSLAPLCDNWRFSCDRLVYLVPAHDMASGDERGCGRPVYARRDQQNMDVNRVVFWLGSGNELRRTIILYGKFYLRRIPSRANVVKTVLGALFRTGQYGRGITIGAARIRGPHVFQYLVSLPLPVEY